MLTSVFMYSIPAPLLGFKDSRMTPFGVDNSAKLSAYFAAGCLSPRTAVAEARAAQADAREGAALCSGTDTGLSQGTEPSQGSEAADNTPWLLMHLCIR